MGIGQIPTKTNGENPGEIGTPVIDRPRPLNPDVRYDIVAAKMERIKDQIIENSVAIGTTTSPAPGSLEAKVLAASSGNVIWRWNGADLTQFRVGGTPELDTTGGALLTLSTYHGQPTLRFTGGGAFGFAQWVIDPAEFPNGVPIRYVLEIIYDQFDSGAGVKNPSGTECGFSHFCRYNSPGNVRAWSLAQSGNGNFSLQIFTRDTVFANSGGTPGGEEPGTGTARGAIHRLEVTQTRGTPFDLFYFGRFRGNTTETLDSAAGGAALDFDGGAYDGLVPNTVGIAYRDNVGQSSFVEISSIRLLKHPAVL